MKREITSKIKEARESGDMTGVDFWQSVKWLSGRRSTKGWSLDQLINRVIEVNASFAEYRIVS